MNLNLKHCKSQITGEMVDFAELACDYLKQLDKHDLNFLEHESNKGELAAFVAFGISFPTDFLALVDTYNVLKYIIWSLYLLKFEYYSHEFGLEKEWNTQLLRGRVGA